MVNSDVFDVLFGGMSMRVLYCLHMLLYGLKH